MAMKTYYAGMDLDAPCGRCKQETGHRVLTLTNGVPDNLICDTCKSVHKFRPEKPAKSPSPVRVAHGAASPKPRPTASPTRFQELMQQEQAGANARPYSPTIRFEEGQWVEHTAFGLGKVQKRFGKKVDVLFREGLKTLISG